MMSSTAPGYQFQLFMRTTGGATSWRLLSGNNREVGRAALGYSDAEMCRDAIGELRAREPELVSRVRRTADGRWTWQILLADRVVATASQSADRQIRAEIALAAFRASLADATIRPKIVMTEARRWRTGSR